MQTEEWGNTVRSACSDSSWLLCAALLSPEYEATPLLKRGLIYSTIRQGGPEDFFIASSYIEM
jgi:hypothetical protein